MKRILSLFLITVLLITSLSFSVQAEESSAAYNAQEASLLYALGVTEAETLTGAPVTRAQFVRYVMKLAGIPLTPYKGTQFADVPNTHVDYEYIMSAVDFGLISIADNFRPEDTIASTEAIKITVELLGYDFMADAKGGYPTGYLQTAQTIDLLDGVSTSLVAMSEYDVCTLLCNALKVHLPETSYTGDGNNYSVGLTTILSHYRGIVEVSGIVDGVSHYGEYKASGYGENNISIGGTAYYTGDLNCDLLFGYDVVAYYDTKAKKLISCTPSESNRIVSVYAEDIESFVNGTYTYTDKDSKSRTVSIGIDSTVFYNGRIIDYDSSKMKPESGSLTFVSPKGSGVYPTLYITSYKTIVAKRISQGDEYIIVDKYASSDGSLIIDPDNTELLITDQDGNEMSFSAIVPGDVINVTVSDDKKLVEIIRVKDEFIGTYSASGGDYIEVDGSQYRLTSALKDKISDVISLGKKAIFCLDIDQRIADVRPSQGSNEAIGYLVVGKMVKNGLSSRLAVRILNLDSKIYDYDFADTFTINGDVYKDFEKAWGDHKSPDYDSLVCSVVKYSLNDKGEIRSLTYSNEEGGDGGLYLTDYIENSTGEKLSQWFNTIGNEIITNTGTIIFKVPNPIYSVGRIDDDLYSVEKAQIFYTDGSTRGYKLVGYTTVPDDGMSAYLLAQKLDNDADTNVAIADEAHPYMVNSVRQVVVDGEVREKMELCNNSNPISEPLVVYSRTESYFTDNNVQAGDIVRINIDENNIVRGLELVWKNGQTKFVDGTTERATNLSLKNTMYRLKIAYAYAFRTDVLDAVSIDVAPANATRSDKMPLYLPSKRVFKYDDRLKSIVEIPIKDIKDYKNFGDAYSIFIYHKAYEGTHNVFYVK